MGLLLLTTMLMSIYFQSGTVVSAQQSFTISSVTISIEPHTNVPRNTNVTIRCKAKVLISGSEAITRKYAIYKDNDIVNSQTTSSSEDFLYHLFDTRVSNSGKYKCQINIEDQYVTSEAEKLIVTGLSKPFLQISKHKINEGENVMVSCSAPDETGSIFVYFYDNSKEIYDMQINSHATEAKIHLKGAGHHEIHCSYTILLMGETYKSEKSNVISVTVEELSIAPVLEVFPENDIYEGDPLRITCTVRNFLQSSESLTFILSEGIRILGQGDSSINYTMTAPASVTSLTFECMLIVKNVKKIDTKTVSVTELFSKPTLTMYPPQVFQNDSMTLTCRSENVATEKLDKSDLTFTLYLHETVFISKDNGVFSVKALPHDFNCTCKVEARNIQKSSQILTVRPKVLVSAPEISVDGLVILEKPFKIRCQSVKGSLPITYTLYKDHKLINETTIQEPDEDALFNVSINHREEINHYLCEASNKFGQRPRSEALDAFVIEPVNQVELITVSGLQDYTEGNELHLLCSVEGTPPITINWYQVGNSSPLNTTTSNMKFGSYIFSVLTKQDSGEYICVAENLANNKVKSNIINIKVQMAMWKKVLIGGTIFLMMLVLLIVGCVMYIKSKRDAVSFYDDKEGRVTNGTRASVASLPVESSNRSSYSIPATV